MTDKLLFLHLHKSGGTFVNKLLFRCMPTAARIGYHLPYREVPAEFRDRPVLGTVRSPWAYYVSWYHFQAGLPKRNPLFNICSNSGALGFGETVANLVGLADDEGRLSALEAALPATYSNVGLNLTKACVGDLRESKLGFYSFLYQRLYAGAVEPRIMCAERLRQELRAALFALGDLNVCAEEFLHETPDINVSQHDAPAAYYDDELAALVAERDSSLVERYGYVL